MDSTVSLPPQASFRSGDLQLAWVKWCLGSQSFPRRAMRFVRELETKRSRIKGGQRGIYWLVVPA